MRIENARGFREATMLLVQSDGHIREAMEAAQLPYTPDDVRDFLDGTPSMMNLSSGLRARITGVCAGAMLAAVLIERGDEDAS